MNVTVPEDFQPLLDGGVDPSQEVRVRLAAHFYSIGEISVGRAAELAGLTRFEFERWLRDHHIDMPWSVEDLRNELDWVKNV